MNKLLLALNKLSGVDLEALLVQLKDANKEVESLKNKVDETTTDNSCLKSQVADLKQQIVNQADEIIALQTELKTVGTQVVDIQEAKSLLLEKYQKQVDACQDLQNKLLSLQNELETTKLDAAKYHADLEALKQCHDDLLTAHDALKTDHQALQNAKELLEKEQHTKILSLQSDNDSLKCTNVALQQTNASLQQSNESLQHSNESISSAKKELEVENASLHNKIVMLEQQTDQDKHNLVEEQQKFVDLQNKLAELQQKYAKQHDETTQHQKNLSELEHLFSDQKNLLVNQQQKLVQQEQTILEQKKMLDEKLLLLQEKQQKEQTYLQQQQALQTELNHCNSTIQKLQTEIEQKHHADVQERQKEQQKYQAMVQKLQSELQLKQKEEELHLQALKQKQDAEIKSLHEKLQHTQDEAQQKSQLEWKKKLEDSEQKLIEKQSEVEAFRQKFVQMETERVQLLQEIATLKQQHEQALIKQTPELPQWMQHEGNYFVHFNQAVRLKYQGIFHGHMMEQDEDKEHYPYSREPLYQIQVARWTDIDQMPVCLAGRLLDKGLKLLEKLDAGIRIRTRAALPVDGTEWGLHPDVLIEWPEQDLYVAVHVDAPYDLQSGATLHDSTTFTDEWINYYYTSQGACVVRVAEEQVIEDYEQVLSYLSNYLYEQTGDVRLMQRVAWGVSSPLWNNEGAQMAAMHHYREQYLGTELLQEALALDKNMPSSVWSELPFTIDQLPAEVSKLAELKQSLSQRFVVITTRPYNSQIVMLSQQVQYDQLCLHGVDQIKNTELEIPFWAISKIEGRADIDKPIEGKKQLSVESLQAILADAVCQYHPVVIQYQSSNGSMQQTVLYWLTFASMHQRSLNLPYGALFQDLMTDAVNPEILVGMSAAHHKVMQISLRDIHSIRVLDLYVTEREGIGALVNGIYCAVLYHQAPLAEMLYNNLPADVKPMPYVQANYAHLCMLNQNYKQAYAIYSSIPPHRYMQENVTWEDMITNDFTELIKNDVEPQLFIRMAHDLNRIGWHFE